MISYLQVSSDRTNPDIKFDVNEKARLTSQVNKVN